MAQETPKTENPQDLPKKEYQKPVVKRHGNVRNISQLS